MQENTTMVNKKQYKTKGTTELNGEILTSLTKIEIQPIMNQSTYAITLRFNLTDSFTFPDAFADGKTSSLTFSHPSLPKPFKFTVEYMDLGIEDNSQFAELTVFLKGRKQKETVVFAAEKPQLLVL